MTHKSHKAMDAALAELDRRRALALGQGGPKRIAVQHGKGRLTARERLAMMVDPGSFVEIGQLALSDREEVAEQAPCDALITGIGLIDGRKAAIIVGDATVMAGSTGSVGGRKQGIIAALATRKGYPLVVLGDANGGRLPDFLGSGFTIEGGNHEGETMFGVRQETDRIPRVTAALGNSYGDPSLWAALSDFVVMPENCTIGLSGPELVGAAIGEKTTHEELGGPAVAAKLTGIVTNVVPTEQDCMDQIRRFLSYLPSNATQPPPVTQPCPPKTPGQALYDIVPEEHKRAYNMHKVIDAVVDEGSFFEMHAMFGKCLITGFARIEGKPVGILASQPMQQAGVLDSNALIKATKLVGLCDDFGLPLVFLQDLPGVIIGNAAERTGLAMRMMELFKRLAKARAPRVTVILRKAYGFGWMALGGTPMGVDYICAWAGAQIGFMAASNSAEILHRREILEVRQTQGEEAAARLIDEFESKLARDNAPWTAAAQVSLHDVIKPEETRQAIINGLF
ncbi:MAG: carboxyl transferase domain-containing protein, partial [Georgfuchsia sp.]